MSRAPPSSRWPPPRSHVAAGGPPQHCRRPPPSRLPLLHSPTTPIYVRCRGRRRSSTTGMGRHSPWVAKLTEGGLCDGLASLLGYCDLVDSQGNASCLAATATVVSTLYSVLVTVRHNASGCTFFCCG